MAAQRLGFSLDEIADLLDVRPHRHARRSNGNIAARAADKLADVKARIAEMELIRDRLRAVAEAGCDDLQACVDSRVAPFHSRRWQNRGQRRTNRSIGDGARRDLFVNASKPRQSLIKQTPVPPRHAPQTDLRGPSVAGGAQILTRQIRPEMPLCGALGCSSLAR